LYKISSFILTEPATQVTVESLDSSVDSFCSPEIRNEKYTYTDYGMCTKYLKI